MKKKDKLLRKHKLFVDELFKNGFNQSKAYREVFNVTNDNYSKVAACRLLKRPEVIKYYEHKYEEYRKKLEIDKEKMIDKLMEELNLFDEMKYLANKDFLNKTEEERFKRLSTILKGSDANKIRDMINKLQGNYEANKIEHLIKEQPLFGPINNEEEEED